MAALNSISAKEVKSLQSEIKKLTLKSENLNKELEKTKSLIVEKDKSISKLQSEITGLLQKINISDTKNNIRPMIKVDDLTRQLCDAVEKINDDAKQKSNKTKPKMLVDQFDVEIKAGLDITNGIRLTQLQGQELSPESVSTIKFSLRPVPVISIADDSDK